jgi:hypothetical protein
MRDGAVNVLVRSERLRFEHCDQAARLPIEINVIVNYSGRVPHN